MTNRDSNGAVQSSTSPSTSAAVCCCDNNNSNANEGDGVGCPPPPQAPGSGAGAATKASSTTNTTKTTTKDERTEEGKTSYYYACCKPRDQFHVPLLRALLAETIGTAMIVLFGCGSVVVATTTPGAYVGIWQVAAVWGTAVTVAILVTADVSGAHLNPAVTISFWLVRPDAHGMTLSKTCWYVLAQLIGGIIGGAMNLMLYDGTIRAFERENDIVRGDEMSIVTAAAFGEYFPNPSFTIEYGGELYLESDVTTGQALLVEAWGTFVLCGVIFGVTHPRNQVLENSCTRVLVPFVIGMTVSMLLACYAPITQAGWNPARDFGPRIVAALAGWGHIAIPGPRNGFWVYIVGPLIGGPLGSAFVESIVFGTVLDRQFDKISSGCNLDPSEHTMHGDVEDDDDDEC